MKLIQRNAPSDLVPATDREPRGEVPFSASSEARQERLKQYSLDQFAELHRLREAFLAEKQAHVRSTEHSRQELEKRDQDVEERLHSAQTLEQRLNALDEGVQERERCLREREQAAVTAASVPAPEEEAGANGEADDAPGTATMDLGNFCKELHQEHRQQWEWLRAEKGADLLKLQQQHEQERQQWEQLRADKEAAGAQLEQQHEQERRQWAQLRADKEAAGAQLEQQHEQERRQWAQLRADKEAAVAQVAQQRQLLERLARESERAPRLDRYPPVPEIGAVERTDKDARGLGLDSLRTRLDEEAHTLLDCDGELDKKKELYQKELDQEQERLHERSSALTEWQLRLQREQQQWAEQHHDFRDAELRVRDAELQVRAWLAVQEYTRQRSVLTQERLGIVQQRAALHEGRATAEDTETNAERRELGPQP